MKKVLLLLLVTLSVFADYFEPMLPSTNAWDTTPTIEQTINSQQSCDQSNYYPTQTEPAPKVMYDYRAPSYDIYNYELAPQY